MFVSTFFCFTCSFIWVRRKANRIIDVMAKFASLLYLLIVVIIPPFQDIFGIKERKKKNEKWKMKIFKWLFMKMNFFEMNLILPFYILELFLVWNKNPLSNVASALVSHQRAMLPIFDSPGGSFQFSFNSHLPPIIKIVV